MDFENEDNTYFRLLDSIEDFDKVQNYKFYFPEFNFKEIKHIYNEKNPSLRMHKRKKIELQRLNKYTFRAIFMYEKLKEKKFAEKKRTKSSKFKDKIFVKQGERESSNINANIMPYEKYSTISPYIKKANNLKEGKKKFLLTDLVMMIVKKQQEKKKKKQWLLFEWIVKKVRMLIKI